MVNSPIPIYGGDAVSSLLGAMFFPQDRSKAELYASWWLGRAVSECASDDTFRSITTTEIRSILSGTAKFPEIADEAKKSGFAGTQAGALVSYMWHAHKFGSSASWNDAAKGIERLAVGGIPGTRSSLLKSKSDFAPVLHYWGILSIEYGNRFPADFRLFVSQSEMLLREMRALESRHAFAGNSFTSPKVFVPVSAIDWRVAGEIRVGAIQERLAPESKKRASQPQKIPVQK